MLVIYIFVLVRIEGRLLIGALDSSALASLTILISISILRRLRTIKLDILTYVVIFKRVRIIPLTLIAPKGRYRAYIYAFTTKRL